MCGSTLITSRDAFFCRSEYMQLVYIACTPWTLSRGPGAHRDTELVEMEPPTLVKPQALWTGKQVGSVGEQCGGISVHRQTGRDAGTGCWEGNGSRQIPHFGWPPAFSLHGLGFETIPSTPLLQVVSTVVRFFTRGLPPLTFTGKVKVPADYWGGKDSGEGELVFQRGYLMCGIIDKNQFGKYGLVHAIQVGVGEGEKGCLCLRYAYRGGKDGGNAACPLSHWADINMCMSGTLASDLSTVS